MSTRRRCIVCGAEQSPQLRKDLYHCTGCGFWTSDFDGAGASARAAAALDEEARRRALHSLRVANFEAILNRLEEQVTLAGSRLLDVGCGHGWFVDRARQRGADAIGVEPDREVAADAIARGLPVRIGAFPECLQADESFDVIIFNDVLEHLTDLPTVLEACRRHLRADGRLAVNVPVSTGLLFRLSCLAARFGLSASLDRMWQRGFPSPHRSYFNLRNLDAFLARFQFVPVGGCRLRTLTLEGTWDRLRMDRNASLPFRAAAFLAAVTLMPLSRTWPDVALRLYRLEGETV